MYMKNVIEEMRIEIGVFLVLHYYVLLNRSIDSKRNEKLPFIRSIARLEQMFGITFYASEFRNLFHYRNLVNATKEKISEKDC